MILGGCSIELMAEAFKAWISLGLERAITRADEKDEVRFMEREENLYD